MKHDVMHFSGGLVLFVKFWWGKGRGVIWRFITLVAVSVKVPQFMCSRVESGVGGTVISILHVCWLPKLTRITQLAHSCG